MISSHPTRRGKKKTNKRKKEIETKIKKLEHERKNSQVKVQISECKNEPDSEGKKRNRKKKTTEQMEELASERMNWGVK